MKLRVLFVLLVVCSVLVCKKNESIRCMALDDILMEIQRVFLARK